MNITTSKIDGAKANMRQGAHGEDGGRPPRRGRRSVFEELLISLAEQDARQGNVEDSDSATEQVLDAIMYNQLLKRHVRAN